MAKLVVWSSCKLILFAECQWRKWVQQQKECTLSFPVSLVLQSYQLLRFEFILGCPFSISQNVGFSYCRRLDHQNGGLFFGRICGQLVDRMPFRLCFPWTAGAMPVMWTKFGKPHCNNGQTGSSKGPKAGVVVVILRLIEVLSRLPFVALQGQRDCK